MAVRNGKVTDDWTIADLKDTFINADPKPSGSALGLKLLVEIEDLSEPLRAILQKAINESETRDRLIGDVKNDGIGFIGKVDALNADNFPEIPTLEIPAELEDELALAIQRMTEAQERFTTEDLRATSGKVAFGKGTDKTPAP